MMRLLWLSLAVWSTLVMACLANGIAGVNSKMELENVFERRLRGCRYFCQELAAVTVYTGPSESAELDTLGAEDQKMLVANHEIQFGAYVVDDQIALTAGSSFEKLLTMHPIEDIRLCHVRWAKANSGYWRSCGKISEYIFPQLYQGAGRPLDLVMIQIDGSFGALTRDPDLISFNRIELGERMLMYGYGSSTAEIEQPEKSFYWGNAYHGWHPKCGFGDDVHKASYMCVVNEREPETPGTHFKPGDEGGLLIHLNNELGGVYTVSGIITNFNGAYGDVPMILRLDRRGPEKFIRRAVEKMNGKLREAEPYIPDYSEY